ncbi:MULTISPECIES: DUF6646 family protein [Amniculibacterium]|jgi:hypothetical protein|uniref:DUF6646 family protein n=1 Tax=Amniculibacterium TaxID=2715289 RepID=UPI000F5B081A|nr:MULTISPECIES: DUF6646 family protein [Amniculibacterium]
MKKVFFVAALAIFGLSNAQTVAYKGKGDVKGQLAANFQKGGTGVLAGVDYGLGESFSIGAQMSYLLGVDEIAGVKPDFGDRIDAKVRFNANLGSVLKLPSNIDVYPGLDLGLKNFGGHIGARYFFDKGFGVFSEVQFPFAKYSDKNKLFHNLNNQFNFTIGASFDL